MSHTDTTIDWRELYRNALRGLHPAGIAEAQKAIQGRAIELCHAGSTESEEGKELDSAIYFLNLFAMISTCEPQLSVSVDVLHDGYDA